MFISQWQYVPNSNRRHGKVINSPAHRILTLPHRVQLPTHVWGDISNYIFMILSKTFNTFRKDFQYKLTKSTTSYFFLEHLKFPIWYNVGIVCRNKVAHKGQTFKPPLIRQPSVCFEAEPTNKSNPLTRRRWT